MATHTQQQQGGPNDRAHSSAVAPPLTPSRSHRPTTPRAQRPEGNFGTFLDGRLAGTERCFSLLMPRRNRQAPIHQPWILFIQIYTYTIIAVLRTAALVLVLLLLLRNACMHACMAALAS
jgi:hypothetical protein